jgi:hypothetical protein
MRLIAISFCFTFIIVVKLQNKLSLIQKNVSRIQSFFVYFPKDDDKKSSAVIVQNSNLNMILQALTKLIK